MSRFLNVLRSWLVMVSIIAMGNTVQSFRDHSFLSEKLYTGKPSLVNGLQARTFGIWTLLSSVIRCYCAIDIRNKTKEEGITIHQSWYPALRNALQTTNRRMTQNNQHIQRPTALSPSIPQPFQQSPQNNQHNQQPSSLSHPIQPFQQVPQNNGHIQQPFSPRPLQPMNCRAPAALAPLDAQQPRSLYNITLLTFVIALGHFLSEVFVYGTATATIGVLAPLMVASFSILGMLIGLQYLEVEEASQNKKRN